MNGVKKKIKECLEANGLSEIYTKNIIQIIETKISEDDSIDEKLHIHMFNVILIKILNIANNEILSGLINKYVYDKDGIDIDTLINHSDMRLRPDLYIEELKEIEERSQIKTSFKTVDAHCGNCGNNEAYYEFVIVAALDEPKLTIYICSSCDHRWKG